MTNNPTPRPPETLIWGLTPPELPAVPPYLVYSNERRLLTPPECKTLIAIGERKGMKYGSIGNGDNSGGYEDLEYRCAKTCSLNPTDADDGGQDLKWLYAKLSQYVVWANTAYGFHLAGFLEPLQLLKYEVTEGKPPGHYNQHVDVGGGLSSTRKLSIVVQLSHVTEYEGCRLHLQVNRDQEIAEVCQGDMIVFPSTTAHYVANIEKGTRYALVAWVGGPRFV